MAKTGAAAKIRADYIRYPELSQSALAKRAGCSVQNVSQVLETFLDTNTPEQLADFQTNKAEVYDAIQFRLLASLTQEKIRNAKPMEAITGAAILEDKARLVRGQATSINANVLMDVVEALKLRQQ